MKSTESRSRVALAALAAAYAFGWVPPAGATIVWGTGNPANGHLYLLLDPGPWAAKEAEAISHGSHLVTINDAAENAWIWQTFSSVAPGNSFWIGLNDAAVEGQFVWSSGEPATFAAWQSGEPNDANGGEDYVESWNGAWNDLPGTPGGMWDRPAIVEAVIPMPPLASAPFIARNLAGGNLFPAIDRIPPIAVALVSNHEVAYDVAVEPSGTVVGTFLETSLQRIDLYRSDPGWGLMVSVPVANGVPGTSLAVEASGAILVLGASLSRLDPVTGAVLDQVPVCAGGTQGGVAVDAAGTIFAASDGCQGIFRVSFVAHTATLLYPAPPGETIVDLALDPSGQLLLSTVEGASGGIVLRRVDPATGAATQILRGLPGGTHPGVSLLAGQVAVDSDGLILLSRFSCGQASVCDEIVKLHPTGAWSVVASGSYGILGLTTATPTSAACSNGLDDDQDGLVDHPADGGCTSASDTSEKHYALRCDDGIDDDHDGWTDFVKAPATGGDPGCWAPTSAAENPQCQNGIDDDQQPGTDFDGGASLNGGIAIDDADPQCLDKPWRENEAGSCGLLGAEVALLVPLAAWWRRRR